MGNKVFSSYHRPSAPTSGSGDLAAAASMDRWTGVVHVPLSRGGPLFRVAASLVLSPAKTLAVRPKPFPFPLHNTSRSRLPPPPEFSDGTRFHAPTRSSSRATASAAPATR